MLLSLGLYIQSEYEGLIQLYRKEHSPEKVKTKTIF